MEGRHQKPSVMVVTLLLLAIFIDTTDGGGKYELFL